MRLAILFAPVLFLVLGSACDEATTVFVQYGCNTEDIVLYPRNISAQSHFFR